MTDNKNIPIRVAPNLTKEKVWLDRDGNQIDGPKGQVVKKANESEEA